jgi:homoserine O-acetyltransferase/O-succinyltransferase
MIRRFSLLAAFFPFLALAADSDLKHGQLGTCALESGDHIENCQLGYRTFGSLNTNKSNVILFPTWFTGTSESLQQFAAPGKLLDPERYFIVFIDALGDGVSSSPSNSATRPRMQFPKFTIRDMVETEYRLATEVLGLKHVHAVMGISMGGMQTFQWVVSHPEFMDRAIPIVGSPQLTPTDMLLWTMELRALQDDPSWKGGNYEGHPNLKTVSDIHEFALTTPSHLASATTRADFKEWLGHTEASSKFDWNDWHRQLEAMLAQDVARDDGGSLASAAKRVKAKMLIVESDQDHMVNPLPAKAFAKLLNAPVVALTGDCGHIATGCESEKMNPAIQEFLKN